MVPPEELEMAQPTTLPADFSEWDSGEAPVAQPAKPATARVAVPSTAERAHSKVSFSPAKVQPEVEKLFQPRQPDTLDMAAEKQEVEGKGKRKPMVLIGAVGSLVILLALGSFGYYKFRIKTIVLPPPVATLSATNASVPVTSNMPAATPASAPTPAASEPDRPNAQAAMMNHQLNAPSRIPNDLRMLAGKEPPPSSGFTSAGIEGLGGTPGNVFNGQNGPKVKIEAPRKMSISAGVAGGLLVQRSTPVYPQIAKEARVSGTVVLQATISKTGLIENLRVVSGPTMLRQSALDAVKSWRYRPYMLDGSPVEVETTVNVTFTLGG